MPETSFVVVTTAEHARSLAPSPANVTVETDLPFGEMRRRLASARVVALPVRENSYSGATTVLLQAMASGKPVVVTRTRAIASGYHLRRPRELPARGAGRCGCVRPRALGDVLEDEAVSQALGARARETVERDLSWNRFAERIEALVRGACSGSAASLRSASREG